MRSEEYVCSRSIVGVDGSNSTEGMDIRLLFLLCVVQVAASVTSRSPVQRSSAECACVSNCVRSININNE